MKLTTQEENLIAAAINYRDVLIRDRGLSRMEANKRALAYCLKVLKEALKGLGE